MSRAAFGNKEESLFCGGSHPPEHCAPDGCVSFWSVCHQTLKIIFYNNPTPLLCRLAEKYKESLANKEKILKEIEVKKEYLSNLQPRLNSIMQVCSFNRCLTIGAQL